MPESVLPPLESIPVLTRWLGSAPLPAGGLYLVGGSIRDLLLGRPIKDVDLTCRGARDFAVLLARIRRARCVPLGQAQDPPSFRVVDSDDHADFVDVTELFGLDIDSDLARRDFTANALALRLDSRETVLIDPFQGRRDIDQGLLRQVGPSSFTKDPLRILRGFRLRAQLGWEIEPATLQAMVSAATMLPQVAGERTAAELRLILQCPCSGQTIREIARLQVLDVLFPEMTALRGCRQNRYHHLDVLDHSLTALDCCETLVADITALCGACIPLSSSDMEAHLSDFLAATIQEDLSGWRLPWLKLAVLLHDLGKPDTRALHPRTGQATFYGHDAVGARLASRILRRLRLSRSEDAYIADLIRNHLHVGALLTPEATTRARMRLLRRLGPDVIPSVLLCLADTMAALGPASTPEFRRTKRDQALRLLQDAQGRAKDALSSPAFVSGHDLLRMGLRPGPKLGRVLKAVREAQDAGEVHDRAEALRLVEGIVALLVRTDPSCLALRTAGGSGRIFA